MPDAAKRRRALGKSAAKKPAGGEVPGGQGVKARTSKRVFYRAQNPQQQVAAFGGVSAARRAVLAVLRVVAADEDLDLIRRIGQPVAERQQIRQHASGGEFGEQREGAHLFEQQQPEVELPRRRRGRLAAAGSTRLVGTVMFRSRSSLQ